MASTKLTLAVALAGSIGANTPVFVLIALYLFDINNYFCSHDQTTLDFFRYFQ